MRVLDLHDYMANSDLPVDDERHKIKMGATTYLECPACEEQLPERELDDLLDDCGRASGTAFVECPHCNEPLYLETELVVYAHTARRRTTQATPEDSKKAERGSENGEQ